MEMAKETLICTLRYTSRKEERRERRIFTRERRGGRGQNRPRNSAIHIEADTLVRKIR